MRLKNLSGANLNVWDVPVFYIYTILPNVFTFTATTENQAPRLANTFNKHLWKNGSLLEAQWIPAWYQDAIRVMPYQDISDNLMLQTLWEQFGDGPFLFKHDCAPCMKQGP